MREVPRLCSVFVKGIFLCPTRLQVVLNESDRGKCYPRSQGGSLMQSSGGSPNRYVSDGQPSTPLKAKNLYSAPKFTVLSPDQAVANLKAKGLPGDREVQKLLELRLRLVSLHCSVQNSLPWRWEAGLQNALPWRWEAGLDQLSNPACRSFQTHCRGDGKPDSINYPIPACGDLDGRARQMDQVVSSDVGGADGIKQLPQLERDLDGRVSSPIPVDRGRQCGGTG